MNKLLVSDLDGTFLEPDGAVPENANIFIDCLREKGFIIIFATARPFGNVKNEVLKHTKPDWLICNDGSIAIELRKGQYLIVVERNLSLKIAKLNVTYFKNLGIKPLIFLGSKYDFEVLIPEDTSKALKSDIKKSDVSRNISYYSNANKVLNRGSIRAISLYGDISKKLSRGVKELNKGKANVMYYKETRFEGGGLWLDVISLKADKFLTSLEIAKRFNKDRIDVALGNGLNDSSIMTNALWSACPNTAEKELIKKATFRSRSEEGNRFLKDVMKQLEGR